LHCLVNTLQQQKQRRFMALYPGLPGWAGTRRNIHPLTPILTFDHLLSASSMYHDPQHSPCSIYVPDSHFAPPLSRSSLVKLLVWNPPHHIWYILHPVIVFFLQDIPSQLFCYSTEIMSSIPSISLNFLCETKHNYIQNNKKQPPLAGGGINTEEFFSQFKIMSQ